MRLALIVWLAFLAAASSIAPEVILRAYVGGSGTDDCDGIAVDRAGDIYLACHSDSPDFPHAPHQAAPQSRDAMDAVVLKVRARTGQIEWATRSGGTRWDAAGEIEVAEDGAVYVIGSTESEDFPTTPDAVQRRFGGPPRDGFLLKLDSRGGIAYSTLLGGSKNDETTSMAVVKNGEVFIGGVTMSPDFPGARVAQFGPVVRRTALLRDSSPEIPTADKPSGSAERIATR
jgi:Beta-propeller repeat